MSATRAGHHLTPVISTFCVGANAPTMTLNVSITMPQKNANNGGSSEQNGECDWDHYLIVQLSPDQKYTGPDFEIELKPDIELPPEWYEQLAQTDIRATDAKQDDSE